MSGTYLKRKAILFLSSLVVLMLVNPASAELEITDFFSDFTSSDVTFNSNQDFQGKAVFELFFEKKPVESHEVPIRAKAGEPVYKVIVWQGRPQSDYYIAKVSIFNDSKLLASKTLQVSYGTAALPAFHVVDFSPANSGVQLLLRPFNPSVADIKIELFDGGTVIYTKMMEDVPLTQTSNPQIKITWPFLLTNNMKYTSRAKIYSHMLYAPPLINTYVANFTATRDVEIISDDVEVDEYGASVTILGKSQVPFDGSLVVIARSRTTNETQTYRQKMDDILTIGKEGTAGIVWRGLVPGTYDVEIRAEDQENITIDKYETALRIPEYPAATVTAAPKGSSGFETILFVVTLLAASRRLKGV